MGSTEQELFWSGQFGEQYIERNCSEFLDSANINLFSEIFSNFVFQPKTLIEFGANIGNNLKAIKKICPHCKTIGVEINSKAAQILKEANYCDLTINDTILNIDSSKYKADISMTKGVLIHINPDSLPKVYEKLYECSNKYIIVNEYYNPTPVEINYRGHSNKLFKRDFAGEIMNKYPDLNLINYGFKYRGDKLFPQDDLTWFLLSKKNGI